MNTKLQAAITIIALIIPFILIAIFYDDLPDQIPMHWNINGEVDKWADKNIGIWALPGISVFMAFVMSILHKIDPKKNIELFKQTISTLRMILSVFLTLIFAVTIVETMEYDINLKLMPIVVVALILVLGNYMGKLRPNYFVGVKTPWTLESEEVWIKTHRLTGYIWVIASSIMLIVLFLNINTWFRVLFGAYMGLRAVVPIL